MRKGELTMDLFVAVAEYKKQLKVRGYAQSTIDAYTRNLDLFKRYLQDNELFDLRKVTHQVIVDYQQQVIAEPIGMESKAHKIRPVKRLFEYLTQTHRLLLNPTEGIVETCRKNRKPGTVISVDEMMKLLDQPNLSLRPHLRNKAILEILYATGIRLNELVSLKVYDVDLKDKVLHIQGKGRKQRVVPLGKRAAGHLKEYLEKIRPWWARRNPKERSLFLNHHGQPLSKESVQVFIRRYRLSAGIKKPASPHTFRRSCATHMLQQGADIRYIQKLLGHQHLSTTQIYTRVVPAEVKETHNKTHPGVTGTRRKAKGSRLEKDESYED
jgi:integrase/recombinase XerD